MGHHCLSLSLSVDGERRRRTGRFEGGGGGSVRLGRVWGGCRCVSVRVKVEMGLVWFGLVWVECSQRLKVCLGEMECGWRRE